MNGPLRFSCQFVCHYFISVKIYIGFYPMEADIIMLKNRFSLPLKFSQFVCHHFIYRGDLHSMLSNRNEHHRAKTQIKFTFAVFLVCMSPLYYRNLHSMVSSGSGHHKAKKQIKSLPFKFSQPVCMSPLYYRGDLHRMLSRGSEHRKTKKQIKYM